MRGLSSFNYRINFMTEPKLHYFNDSYEASHQDVMLGMAKLQGYVPVGCLLGGAVVMSEVEAGRDPCAGCAGPRHRCGGRPRKDSSARESYPDPMGSINH